MLHRPLLFVHRAHQRNKLIKSIDKLGLDQPIVHKLHVVHQRHAARGHILTGALLRVGKLLAQKVLQQLLEVLGEAADHHKHRPVPVHRVVEVDLLAEYHVQHQLEEGPQQLGHRGGRILVEVDAVGVNFQKLETLALDVRRERAEAELDRAEQLLEEVRVEAGNLQGSG